MTFRKEGKVIEVTDYLDRTDVVEAFDLRFSGVRSIRIQFNHLLTHYVYKREDIDKLLAFLGRPERRKCIIED